MLYLAKTPMDSQMLTLYDHEHRVWCVLNRDTLVGEIGAVNDLVDVFLETEVVIISRDHYDSLLACAEECIAQSGTVSVVK
jgi:hypothetical protein